MPYFNVLLTSAHLGFFIPYLCLGNGQALFATLYLRYLSPVTDIYISKVPQYSTLAISLQFLLYLYSVSVSVFCIQYLSTIPQVFNYSTPGNYITSGISVQYLVISVHIIGSFITGPQVYQYSISGTSIHNLRYLSTLP